MCDLFRWLLLVALLALPLVSGCHRFHDTFPAISVTCGEPPSGLTQDYLALRPVVGNEVFFSTELSAEWVAHDAKRTTLPLTAKGCVYVPRTADGFVMFTDRGKERLGLKALSQSLESKKLIEVPLQDFAKLTANLSCSGQDIWTNQPFVSVAWNLQQSGRTLSRAELVELWASLDLKILSRNPSGEVRQTMALSLDTVRNLQPADDDATSFALQMSLAPEQITQLELHFIDGLGRSQTVGAGAACRIHMTKRKPDIISFVPDIGAVRIERGQAVSLQAPTDTKLFLQVKELAMDSQQLQWSALSSQKQEQELKEFREGRSPIFWQEGSYLLRAYTQDLAGNRSDVWERGVHVIGSPLMERQITPRHWVLNQATNRQTPALLELDRQDSGGRLVLHDLGVDGREIEIWQPKVAAESLALFDHGFNINRQVIEGFFGFQESKKRQYCVSRGRQVADAFRPDFTGRIVCWERNETGQLQLVLDVETPFWDTEFLDVAHLDREDGDEILAFSSLDGNFRFFKPLAQSLRLMTESDLTGINELSWDRTQVGAQFAAFQSPIGASQVFIVDTKHESAGILSNGITGPNPTLYFYTSQYVNTKMSLWGVQSRDKTRVPALHERYLDRIQLLRDWEQSRSVVLSQNSDMGIRWMRRVRNPEQDRPDLVRSESLEQPGLPHAGSELCYFFYRNDQSLIPDCLSFSVDPHARPEVHIYRYDAEQKSWGTKEKLSLGSAATVAMNQSYSVTENPAAIQNIVQIPHLQAYRLMPEDGPLNWHVLALEANESLPEFNGLSAEDRSRLRSGQGPLEMFGIDQRFVVWFGADSERPSNRRELRFAGATTQSTDLSHGAGLIDLDGTGLFYLVQPTDAGFATLPLRDGAEWKAYSKTSWPGFVEGPLGWNGRSLSLLRVRLPGSAWKTPAFCYVARGDSQNAGRIACYALDPTGQELVKAHEGDFPLQYGEEIATVEVNGKTVFIVFNRFQNILKAFEFESEVFTVKPIDWTNGREYSIAPQSIHGSGVDPRFLHLAGQLQSQGPSANIALSDSSLGSSYFTQITRGADGRLVAPILYYTGRWGLFSKQDTVAQEDILEQPVMGYTKTRGFYANARKAQDKANCRISWRANGVVNSGNYTNRFCNLYGIQTPDYLLAYAYSTSWQKPVYEANEAAIQQPDSLATEWSQLLWMSDGLNSDDGLFALRIPKKFSREGWSLVKSSSGQLPVPGEIWQTVRTVNLLKGPHERP